MGLNPFRSRVERRTDVVVVVAALVVIVVLVAWGLFGG
jgi:chorismate synthase